MTVAIGSISIVAGSFVAGLRVARIEAGAGATCGEPKQRSPGVAQDAPGGFLAVAVGRADGGKGDALTTEDDGSDRGSPGHVKCGGDQVDVLDIGGFEVGDEGGEIGDGVSGAVVEVVAAGRNVGGLEDGVGLGGGDAARDPDG